MKTLVTKLAATMATAAIPLSGIVFADTHGLSVGVGYRQDSVRWDLNEVEQINPHYESDLHFKDLEIFTVGVRYKGLLGCSYTRSSFEYGWIFDGSLRESVSIQDRFSSDTERFGHNGLIEVGEFARSATHNKVSDSSYVWDFSIAFGVPFDCWCDKLQVAPLIGFSYDRQKLKSSGREGVFAPSLSSIASLDANFNGNGGSSSSGHHGGGNFETSWWGPWFGVDLSYNCECVNIYAEIELHWGRAERERNSSIDIPYFDKYSKTKSFWGPSLRLGSSCVVCECWFVDASIGYKHWYSNSHRDTFDWRSGDVRFDIGYIF